LKTVVFARNALKETDLKKYTVAGIVRARFEQIEKLMYEGMTQTAIVEKLNEELKDVGFETTVENFRNELHRARKKREALGIGKVGPSALTKTPPESQSPKNVSKTEGTGRTSAVSLPPKPETKVYGGTPRGDEEKDLI